MKFAVIAKCRHIWPINWLREALEVSRSGFYAWLKRPPSAPQLSMPSLSPPSTGASKPVTAPMARAAFGMMFWKKGLLVGCIGSSG